jgi:uncharacterized membrane protein YhfC
LFLMGLGVVTEVVGILGPRGSAQSLAPVAHPVWAVLLPVWERAFSAVLHIGSRVLVLGAIARRRPSAFWAAFALMGACDALAALVKVRVLSVPLFELMLLGLALLAALGLYWGTRPPRPLSEPVWSSTTPGAT